MMSIYWAVGITVVLFIILMIINGGKHLKNNITNIFIAVISGVILLIVGNLLKLTADNSNDVETMSPATTATATVTAIVAATTAPTHQISTPNNEPQITFDAQSFMNNYLSDMAKAINNNNFSSVERYLKADSPAYTDQKDYILNYCQVKNIKEYFKNVEILTTDMANKYTAIIDTYETYDLDSPSMGKRTSSFNTRYTVEYIEGNWKISKIENK